VLKWLFNGGFSMSESLLNIVNMLQTTGFLETRASLYMDIIITFMGMLPILIGFSIFMAKRGALKFHQFLQLLFFFLTLISLSLFAYSVHYMFGLTLLIEESSISSVQLYMILLLHIFLSITTMVMWFFTLIYALEDRKRRALPGLYSENHRKSGWRTFLGIFLTSLSSLVLYGVLFWW
jgi:putative membrane protein